MKYDIEREIKELMALHSSKMDKENKLKDLFTIVVNNLSVILTLDSKTEFYRYMDVLLGSIVNTNLAAESKFNAVCDSVIEQGKREGLEKKAAELRGAMQNLWNLLYKTTEKFPEFKGLMNDELCGAITNYILVMAKQYEDERTKNMGQLLQEAGERDVEARMAGKTVDEKDKEITKLSQKIKRREI